MSSTNETRQGQRKRSYISIDKKEEPQKMKNILNKLKDDEYVKQTLEQPDTIEQLSPEKEEYILFIDQARNENKENQRIMRSFEIHELAIYFLKFRMD